MLTDKATVFYIKGAHGSETVASLSMLWNFVRLHAMVDSSTSKLCRSGAAYVLLGPLLNLRTLDTTSEDCYDNVLAVLHTERLCSF